MGNTNKPKTNPLKLSHSQTPPAKHNTLLTSHSLTEFHHSHNNTPPSTYPTTKTLQILIPKPKKPNHPYQSHTSKLPQKSTKKPAHNLNNTNKPKTNPLKLSHSQTPPAKHN